MLHLIFQALSQEFVLIDLLAQILQLLDEGGLLNLLLVLLILKLLV